MPRRPDCGLVTLEWLLIVAAIAAVAGTSVLIVQRVVDDAADVPPDPWTRMIDADIAAAEIAHEAQQAFNESQNSGTAYDDNDFETQCESLEVRFDDVVEPSGGRGSPWTKPTLGDDGMYDTDDDVKARCVLTPRQDLAETPVH